jgi:hypothetical protein
MRDRVTELDTTPEPGESELAASVEQSQDVLIDMLKDRFERMVDAFVRQRIGTNGDQLATLDVLFELYEEGLLTKGEVRRRGDLEPEAFFGELRAYRQRRAAP